MTQFLVPQLTGAYSTVTVTEVDNGGGDKYLDFVTDQQLFTGSNRAWEVEQAIKQYAHERGYRPDKYLETATYDPGIHSHIEMQKVRNQVEADPHYQKAAQLAEAQAKTINTEYGRAVRLLKNLITALEKRQRAELGLIGQQLVATQREAMQNLFIPPVVNERDRGWLDKPFAQLAINSFASYGVQPGEMPDRETLLDLLTLVED